MSILLASKTTTGGTLLKSLERGKVTVKQVSVFVPQLFRQVAAFVPVTPVAPLRCHSSFSDGKFQKKQMLLLRNFGFTFMASAVTIPFIIPMVTNLSDNIFYLVTCWTLMLTFCGFGVFFLNKYMSSASPKIFFSAAVRLTVAKEGVQGSPAAWVLDKSIWSYSYWRATRNFSENELEVVFALAQEWDGTYGELLQVAKMLVPAPAER